MTQIADRMCRGGSLGPIRHIRAAGSLAARMLAVLAAMLLVGAGGGAGHADAAAAVPGVVLVICSDGGPKTIVLDDEGNAIEPVGDKETCPGHGPCCTLLEGCALPPDAQAVSVRAPVATAAVFQAGPAVLRSGPGRRPGARGPPSREDA